MLKYFCAVSQHGSLLDAANELGRTPSAVSMMLKQFEEHVGSPLFESARKSRMTPLGKMIYAEAQREVGHFDNTVSVIEGIARSQTGYLRLVVTPSFATEILPRVVSEYTSQHPKIQIDVRDMDSEAIANALNSGKVRGYGTDVLEVEPPPADHVLLSAKNCIVSPNIGSRTHESVQRQASMAVRNLLHFFQGNPPEAQANKAPWPTD